MCGAMVGDSFSLYQLYLSHSLQILPLAETFLLAAPWLVTVGLLRKKN